MDQDRDGYPLGQEKNMGPVTGTRRVPRVGNIHLRGRNRLE